MGLPLMMIGTFFFFGFRYRAAVIIAALTVTSFITCAVIFGVPQPVALRCSFVLVSALVMGAIAARHFEMKSRVAFLEDRLIGELAEHDPLTGTKNRRVFDDNLARVWQQAIDNRRGLAILLIDVDHFKAYNDRYGHQAGDLALREVAQAAQRFVRRPFDVLARYGGEEFAAILYDVEPGQAQDIAERTRRAVTELGIEHGDSRTAKSVTISIGVAVISPTAERDPRGALQLADQALYEAKVKGRNQIALMDDVHYRSLVTGVFASPSFMTGS